MESNKPDLGSKGLDLRSHRLDLWSERPNLGSERDMGACLRLGGGRTPETEDIDHLSLRGRCPKRITIHLSRRDNE